MDVGDLLEDMRRLLQFYGVFHPYCHQYSSSHWDVPGFRVPCSLMYVWRFFGLL